MTEYAHSLTYPFSDQPGIDLHPVYAGIRDGDTGVARVQLPYGAPAWLVTRYEDVRTVMNDARFSRARSVAGDEPRTMPIIQKANVIMASDAPDHGRLRGLLTGAFTRRRIERMRGFLERAADDLLDGVSRQGPPADLVASYAAPLPALAICELLRVPAPERAGFVRLSERLLGKALESQPVEETVAASRELWMYLLELAQRRSAAPIADDLLSTLVAARDDGTITEPELVAICVTFLVGGHDATTMQIGNSIYRILTRPDLGRQLRGSPELVPAAVEELMRISPIGIGTVSARMATADVKLGQVVVQAGEFVIPAVGAANRDPAVFDEPEKVELGRGAAHLAFGHGMHRCLGAELARIQLQVALGAVVRRFPALRLAVPPQDVPWSGGPLPRSATRLPVAW